MSNKTQFDAVQLNDAELDQVVGGRDVLSLQMMEADGASAAGCVSFCSCTSTVSSRKREVEVEVAEK